MDGLFSHRARRVMELADRAARRHNHEYIGTEHILLGLIEEGEGAAVHALRALGLEPEEIAARAAKMVLPGPDRVKLPRIVLTPTAKRAIEAALLASRELGDTFAGTQHLLLGLIQQEEGIAGQALREFVTREQVCTALASLDQSVVREDLQAPRKRLPCGLTVLLAIAALISLCIWLN